jgi:hypothetical protein
MNKFYLFAIAITFSLGANAQLFFDDFEDNDLTGYTLYNLDGLTPDDPDLENMADSAWTVKFITAQGWEFGYSAFSVSWYLGDEGPSDDWLITPPIEIGEGAILEWDAMAITSTGDFRDRYQVFISNSPELEELGLLAPEFTMGDTGEVDFPIHRTLDLGALGYANETIYVAFRNNTQPFNPDEPVGPGNGGNELAIDNIEVNDNSTLGIEEVSSVESLKVQPNPVSAGSPITVAFSLKEASDIAIDVIDITGKVQDQISNRMLPAGASIINLDSKNLSKGIYFIRVRDGQNSSIAKAIIQ